jgi:uncharacterized protein YjbI with pentapeptide repeats
MEPRVPSVFEKIDQLRAEGKSHDQLVRTFFELTRAPVNPPIEDFSGYEFVDANLAGFSFSNLNFAGCAFFGCELSSADFAGCELRDAVFGPSKEKPTSLRSASFTSVKAQNAIFKADAKGANFTNAKLAGAIFDGAILRGTHFNGASLGGASLIDAVVNSHTQFKDVENVNRTKLRRYTLACLGPEFGGLTEGNRMDMHIVDDVATLRSEFGGVWAILHFAAMIVFIAPYVWFLLRGYSVATFTPAKGALTMPLGIALLRYIVTGGVNWQTSWSPNPWSLVPFAAYAVYNVARGLLLWKTKRLETQEHVTRLPAKFSLADDVTIGGKGVKLTFKWNWVYQAVRWLLYFAIASVLANSFHFLSILIPVST